MRLVRGTLGVGRLVLFALVVQASAAQSEPDGTPPWQSALLRGGDPSKLQTVSAEAEVTVSDGLHYRVTTHYRGPQRAVFHSAYSDRQITAGIDGHYVWQYDQSVEREAGPMHRSIVLGHQFHAELLFLPDMRGGRPTSSPVRGTDCECMTQSFVTEEGLEIQYRYGIQDGLPIRSTTAFPDGMEIDVSYADWRVIDGFYLPYRIEIDDGSRTFDYRFTDIRFDQDDRASLRAPFDVLTDRQKLIRLHRLSMDAHLEGDASLMNDRWAEDVLIVSAGEMVRQSGEAAAAFMTRSLGARRHSVYDDLSLPHVEISEDATLATVTARVRAVGERLAFEGRPGTAFEFVSAWTSTYRKIDGEWRLIGNTSNFAASTE